MRRKVPKPKLQQTIGIPPRLLDFLRYANELIIEADDAATVSSDDLIQLEEFRGYLLAYGGFIEEGDSRFSFTYFSEPKQTRNKLEFELTTDQIAEIAAGRLAELTLWGCSSPDCGRKFQSPDASVFIAIMRRHQRPNKTLQPTTGGADLRHWRRGSGVTYIGR